MNVLVTGGAGFIGSTLADALIAEGHSVHIVDNFYSGKPENIHPKATFHELDICDARTARLIESERFDAIFHQAAQMDVRKSVAEPSFDANVNIMGSLNILEAAQRAGTRKVVFASSGGTVYGDLVQFPAPETHPLLPTSPYGISKLTVEHYLRFYQQVYGMHYVALRYANVYGPRQNPHGEAGVVAIFCSRLLAGQPTIVNGDGTQTRDYVYVDDVVAANLAALHWSGEAGAFNVGRGVETDVNEVFDVINRATGSRATRTHGPAKVGEQLRSVIDPTLAGQVLGWKPLVGVEEGLARTVEWFRQRQA
jgi:UDP-glucose 4-epimerase